MRGAQFTDGTGKVSGAVVGNPMKTTIGPANGYAFDGMGDWLVLSPDISRSRAGLPVRDFTASAWVNLRKTTQYGGIVGAIQDNGGFEKGWQLGYSDDVFTFALATTGADDGDGLMTYLRGTTAIEPGRWYHVAATYDGSAMRLFVNGVQEGESRQQSGEILYPAQTPYTAACYMDDNEKFPMAGALAEVKVLGRAMSAEQVREEFVPRSAYAAYVPDPEKEMRFVVKPYLQSATREGMTFVWETSRAGQGVVEYGEKLPYDRRSAAGSQGTFHEIRVEGLKPATNYFYRVRTTGEDGSEIVGEDLTFRTAVEAEDAFAFTVIGDTQKNKPVIAKLSELAYSLRPNFQIHLGDTVNTGADLSEWVDEMLPASWPLMSRVCVYPTIGNHEENHSNYYKYFSLPGPEYRYTFTYGNAQFFTVDTMKPVTPESEQWKWLDEELSKSKATWKIVYHHHPVWSSDENDHGDTYKEASTYGAAQHRPLAALYEKHGVDINFTGHIHCYERSWPIFEGKVDQARGVTYITSGGGGGGLEKPGRARRGSCSAGTAGTTSARWWFTGARCGCRSLTWRAG